LAVFGREGWGRRFLEDFLVAALEGAFPFVEMQEVAMFIAEELDFYVSGAREIALQQEFARPKSIEGFSLCSLKSFKELVGVVYNPHAFTAAACGCFEEDGVAYLFGGRLEDLGRSLRLVIAGNSRDAVSLHEGTGF